MRLLLSVLLIALYVPAQKPARGRSVAVAGRLGSQLHGWEPCRVVVKELQIGGQKIATRLQGKLLLIARSPGAKPTMRVRSGKRVSWKVGPQKIGALFFRDADKRWFVQTGDAILHEVAGVKIRLLDVDLDGRFDEFDEDGYTIGDSGAVHKLRETFVLGDSKVRVSSISKDGLTLKFRTERLAGNAPQLAALARINELRGRHGLAWVELDPKTARGCTEHARYLAINNWTGWTNPHDQSLGEKGKTPAGLLAARRSVIMKASPSQCVDSCWLTWYHRIGLMSAGLNKVGINAEQTDIGVVDVSQHYEAARTKEWPWREPAFVPGDGAIAFPTRAISEKPMEPVPKLGTRGTPLMAVFRRPRTVRGFSGSLYRVLKRGRRKVKTLAPRKEQFASAFGIIPARPLEGDTAYEAEFEWEQSGKAQRRTIRFRTR